MASLVAWTNSLDLTTAWSDEWGRGRTSHMNHGIELFGIDLNDRDDLLVSPF